MLERPVLVVRGQRRQRETFAQRFVAMQQNRVLYHAKNGVTVLFIEMSVSKFAFFETTVSICATDLVPQRVIY